MPIKAAGKHAATPAEDERWKKRATRNRNKWLKGFAAEFWRLEGLVPVKAKLPQENCPEWVNRVSEEFIRATHPGADLVGAIELTPARLGGLLGYQCANAVWMMEANANRDAAELVGVSSGESEKGLKMFYEWYAGMRHLAGRVLKSVVYQSYEDMSAFLVAYSSAFSKKPKVTAGIGDFGSTAFGIYLFMLSNWRVVDRLDSVRSLHELLRRHLGEYHTGDLKRIEKICQRTGIHYREPGRPKKPKSIQTPS
jgi:hypothetical protein